VTLGEEREGPPQTPLNPLLQPLEIHKCSLSPWAEGTLRITAVRLKVEQNQLVDVFGEIGVLADALKGA
jgi:hypothetical protein